MKDEKLIKLLNDRILQLRELEGFADVVRKVKKFENLGGTYRMLIERVKEAWKAIDRKSREYGKAFKKRPSAIKDPRVGAFNSVHRALLKASSHRRPAVNSRRLQEIHAAAYEIGDDLSRCRGDLEDWLEKENAKS